MRVLLLVASYFACGFSFAQWLWRRVFFSATMNPQDKARLAKFVGFYSYPVEVAVGEWKVDKGFHKLKNIAVEWNKADSQRGIKFQAFLFSLFLLVEVVAVGIWLLVEF